MLKALITKVTSEGESLQFEVNVKDPRDFAIQLKTAYAEGDRRLLEMNHRIIASHNMVKQLPPEAQKAVHDVFEVLFGRRLPRPEELSVRFAVGNVEGNTVELATEPGFPAPPETMTKEPADGVTT